MIVVTGTLRLSEVDLGSVRDVARDTVLATRAEQGCIVYAFSFDLAEPGLMRIYEEWESRAALDAHGRTAHIVAWRKLLSTIAVIERELKIVEIDGFQPFS